MAKTKAWYYWTAIAILSLLTMGALNLSDVPIYNCELEDKYLRCMFLKDNDKTCVEPLMVDGKWTWKGDRCQVGYNYGNWTLVGEISDTLAIKTQQCTSSLGGYAEIINMADYVSEPQNINVYKPTIHYNARYIRKDDTCYVVGNCISVVGVCK